MVKNKRQNDFLRNGIINTMTSKEIEEKINNIKAKHKEEGQALLIALYYSGARPNEILKLKSNDIYKEGSTVFINLQGSKRGLPRKIQLPYNKPLVKKLYDFAIRHPPEILLFYHYISRTEKKYINKKGKIKIYTETTKLVYYYITKWFDSEIIPYFFRHNCFSILSEVGYTDRDIKYLKGSKTMNSVLPYTHLSKARAKKLKFGFNKF